MNKELRRFAPVKAKVPGKGVAPARAWGGRRPGPVSRVAITENRTVVWYLTLWLGASSSS